MMNDEEGGNYEEITEQMIDVKDILNLYASPDILSKGISYKFFFYFDQSDFKSSLSFKQENPNG